MPEIVFKLDIKKSIEGLDFDFWIANPIGQQWYGTNDKWLELRFMRDRILHTSDVVLGLGGHHGFTTTMLALWVGSEGRVVTFELNPENAAIMRKNVELNHLTNISMLQKAVGARNTEASLSDSSNPDIGFFQYVSRSNDDPNSKPVDMVTLDDYVDVNPTVVKIDVEG